MVAESLVTLGAIAGAIASIISLLYKLLIKPFVVTPYKARAKANAKTKAEEDAFKETVLTQLTALSQKQDSMLKDLSNQIASTQDDLGLLQWYKLKETHSRLMDQGWANDDDKESFGRLYEAYKARGRNSVAPAFMNDILELPGHAIG